MTTAAKRAGAKYETDVLLYLRQIGLTAERLAKAGKNDEGDIVFTSEDMTVVMELKVRRDRNSALSLGAWLAEAELEAQHYADARNISTPLPVLLVKRPNKGIGDSFVVMKLGDFIDADAVSNP